MNTLKRYALLGTGLMVVVLASGCASMSECEKHTAAGAAVGGVAGIDRQPERRLKEEKHRCCRPRLRCARDRI